MKIINIGGKDYTFEFSIEASMYGDCMEGVINFMFAVGNAQEEQDIKELLKTMTRFPNTAVTLFYAGLMEHHGAEITNMAQAKKLVKVYYEESGADLYSIIQEMFECMGDDGFFDLIGLTAMTAETAKPMKQPQDHKKKVTKK